MLKAVRRRLRIRVVCLAVMAPLALGGCSSSFCEEPAGNSLEALVKGLLCLGFGFVGGPPSNERPAASVEVRPSTIPSGGVVTLDASGSHGGFDRPVALFKWDIDGEYRVIAGGRRQFDYEFVDQFGSDVSRVRLFRRDPAFVPPLGEILDDGESETRIIGLETTDLSFQHASDVGKVRITGEPVPPGDPTPPGEQPPVAIFSASPVRPSVGQNVVLDATSSERAVTYSWDLDGNGSFETGPSTSPTVTHVFATSGIQVVRLRVTDAAGVTADAPKEIFVAPGGERRSTAVARAAARAAGPGFAARLAKVRFPTELGTPRRAGRALTYGPLRASGRLVAAQSGPGELRPFRRSAWRARIQLSLRPRAAKLRLRGLAVATFARGAGRACLRVRLSARRGGPARGRIAVLGGAGRAAKLAGRGRVRFRFENRTPRLQGRLTLRTGPVRPLPRACAGLG